MDRHITTAKDDTERLAEFAQNRCERAFSALVQKYAAMVFNAALRKTGNRQTAEEVAQNVFILLARKAGSLRKESVLVGWLYRTTMFECTRSFRKESLRRKKMETLATYQSIEMEGHPADLTEDLDAALAKLSHADQNILLLRFYEGLSFREIAQRLGKSENTSQKQASRALDRLRSLFSDRGVTISTTVIVGSMATEFAKAAPAGHTSSLAKGVLSGAPLIGHTTFTTHTIIAMSYGNVIKYTAIIAALAVIPIAAQHGQLSSLRAEISELESRKINAPRAERNTRASPQTLVEKMAISRFTDVDDWLTQTIIGGQNFAAISERVQKLGKLSIAELENLLGRLERHPGAGHPKQEIISYLLDVLSRKEPALALMHAMRLELDNRMSSILGGWAKKDPEAAISWMFDQQSAGTLVGKSVESSIGDHEKWMLWRLTKSVAEHDLKRAVEVAATQTGEKARSALRGIALAHIEGEKTENFMALISGVDISLEEKNAALVKAAAESVPEFGSKVADWMVEHSAPEMLGPNIADLMRTWSGSNSETANHWIATISDTGLRDYALSGLAEGFVTVMHYRNHGERISPIAARKIANQIQDVTMRQKVLERIEERVVAQKEEANK